MTMTVILLMKSERLILKLLRIHKVTVVLKEDTGSYVSQDTATETDTVHNFRCSCQFNDGRPFFSCYQPEDLHKTSSTNDQGILADDIKLASIAWWPDTTPITTMIHVN